MTAGREYQLVVSEETVQMIGRHAHFLYQSSASAAERLVETYEKAVSSLITLPQRCPWYKGSGVPQNKFRYLIFEKRYALLFQIKEDTVYVDYAVDCRQDLTWLFS